MRVTSWVVAAAVAVAMGAACEDDARSSDLRLERTGFCRARVVGHDRSKDRSDYDGWVDDHLCPMERALLASELVISDGWVRRLLIGQPIPDWWGNHSDVHHENPIGGQDLGRIAAVSTQVPGPSGERAVGLVIRVELRGSMWYALIDPWTRTLIGVYQGFMT